MPVRDAHRSRVYAAERLTTDQWPEKPLSQEECYEWVRTEVLRDRWFRRRWPHVRHVQVDKGKVYAYGSYDWVAETGHIVLPDWAGEMTVAHELAHVCTEATHGWLRVAAHGTEWAAMYLALAERYVGKDVSAALHGHLRDCGVNI